MPYNRWASDGLGSTRRVYSDEIRASAAQVHPERRVREEDSALDVRTCSHCGLSLETGAERCRACGWPAPRVLLASRASAPSDQEQGAATAPSHDLQPAVDLAAETPAGDTRHVDGVAVTAESERAGAEATYAQSGNSAPQVAPGYPVYPQGGYGAYTAPGQYPPNPQYYSGGADGQPQVPSQPFPPNSTFPQAYPHSNATAPYQGYPPYPYYPYYYPPAPPRRPRGETYALVVSWIVTVTGGLAVVGGLLSAALLALALTSDPDSLAAIGLLGVLAVLSVVGGTVALIGGISRLLGHPSPRFTLPRARFFVVLALVVLATGIVLWNVYPAPGAALAVFPLTAVAAILPSLAILAFTAHRLGDPSTRRHVWLSFFYGATLAPIIAIILEILAIVVISLVLAALGLNAGSALGNLNASPQNPAQLIAQLLDISVTAAVVEEGVKPLAAVLIMRRLRSPSEAFLVGLAGGIGFNVLEATGYITGDQADWISQALGRSTAGLLHGVGAGMAALGWYYLINGKGVPLRWLRGVGGILYAMLQHATFNASAVLLPLLPPSILAVLAIEVVPGYVPFPIANLVFLAFDGLILGVLIFVTGRLRRAGSAPPRAGTPATAPPSTYQDSPALPVGGGAR